MNRTRLREYFKSSGPVVLPVIHVLDIEQTSRNVDIAINEGAAGVFLINHDFEIERFLPIIRSIRSTYPSLWLGINFLAVTGRDAFPVLSSLEEEGFSVDGYWADDARIDERRDADDQPEAAEILSVKKSCGWGGLYFGGTAFKKQRVIDHEYYLHSAAVASRWMDVVTTSGVATGQEAAPEKVNIFRAGAGDNALALASGVTPENVQLYADSVDAILVATGINVQGDFYNIDPSLLRRLVSKTRRKTMSEQNSDKDRNHRWYLDLMAPRTRGEKFAWLDPSAAYINARSFHAMLDDLLEPFSEQDVDVVAGFDAAGFVLGTGMATRCRKGFRTIRKGGKIPVDHDVVAMSNYSGQTQEMEMRKPAFARGTRVLLVDQWIETGGTMQSGIQLVERQGGVVAGIAAVCIEDNDVTAELYRRYKMSSCVVPGSEIQAQCNRQTLDSFETFKPENTFPEINSSKQT
jgi:adenine phosphoribosyltransferase